MNTYSTSPFERAVDAAIARVNARALHQWADENRAAAAVKAAIREHYEGLLAEVLSENQEA